MTRLERSQFEQFLEYYNWLGEHPEAMKMNESEAWEYYLRITGDKEEIDRCPRTGFKKDGEGNI